jgi:hypothetical protein
VNRWIRPIAAFAALNAVLLASISYVRFLVGDAPDANLAVAVLFCIGQVVIVAGTVWMPIQRALA